MIDKEVEDFDQKKKKTEKQKIIRKKKEYKTFVNFRN